MREELVKVYTFEELDESAKENAREWFRECLHNDFEDESDAITEMFQEYLAEQGYNVDFNDISWSLSSCQGDGVSFVWSADGNEVLSIFSRIYDGNIPKNVKRVIPFLEFKFVRDDSRYCHAYTVSTEIEIQRNYNGEIARVEGIIEEIERILDDDRLELCDAMGKIGYEEIAYQFSNECIDELMKASGYEFTEDGKAYR